MEPVYRASSCSYRAALTVGERLNDMIPLPLSMGTRENNKVAESRGNVLMASASSESNPARAQRADKLLACFQSALNHDLPNQLVALQGLVQLLDFEQKGTLGSDSKELLQRLEASARRALDTIFVMRDLQRLTSNVLAKEKVRLAELAPDVVRDIRSLFPDFAADSRLSLEQNEVDVVRQALHRALVQLGRLALGLARGSRGTIEIGCRARTGKKEVWIRLEEPVLEGSKTPGPLKGAEKRYEFLVARELADGWGGTLHQQAGPTGPVFLLAIPE
jgi:hypothetical protein